MKKIFVGIALTIVSLFVFSQAAVAQEPKINKDIVTLSKDEVVNKDYFAAGGISEIHGTVNGDAYIGGGQVMFDGVVKGDLIVGGGTVYVMGNVNGNLRVAGGQVVISGKVEKNITAIGGSIEITDGAEIGGSLTAAGGNININAPISGGANVASGNLSVNSAIGGDLTARFGTGRFTANSRVNGNFDYWAEENASVDQNAFISGTIRKHEMASVNAPSKKQVNDFRNGVRTMFGLSSFVTTLAIGLMLLKFAPKFMSRTSEIVQTKFLNSVGMGILVFVVFPIALVLMFITILGIPLAIMSTILFVIFVYVSRVFAIVAVGSLVVNKLMKKNKGMGWGFFSGLVLYYLLGILPFLGGIIKLFVVTSGLGASVISLRSK